VRYPLDASGKDFLLEPRADVVLLNASYWSSRTQSDGGFAGNWQEPAFANGGYKLL